MVYDFGQQISDIFLCSVGEEYEVDFPRSRGSGLGFYLVDTWKTIFYDPGEHDETGDA